jgi:hypothetical protein
MRKFFLTIFIFFLVSIVCYHVIEFFTDPNERMRIEQKYIITQWINACPKDAELSQKFLVHFDRPNDNGIGVLMMTCTYKIPKKV